MGFIDSAWRALFHGERSLLLRAAGCFLVLASVTAGIAAAAGREIEQVARERFLFKVAESRQAVRQRLSTYEQVLRGASAFLDVSHNVTRADWRTYVNYLDFNHHFPGIQAIAYSPLVPREYLGAYLAKVRRDGFPEFAIFPAGVRTAYAPVTYIEPFDWRNRRAFGFDLLAEPQRREALLRARDTAAPAATGKLVLKQETDRGVQSGFLMCAPLFPGDVAPAAPEARRSALRGFTCAVFRLEDLMRGIFGPTALPHTRLEIFDGAEAEPANLMYDSMDDIDAHAVTPAFTRNETFEFGGRHWTLRVSSTQAFDRTIDVQMPRIVLFGGLLVSALFSAVVWTAGHNRMRARQIAIANRDLERAKEAAEAASLAKGEFLANVSHELRTPLTLILAPLEQLSTNKAPPPDWPVHIERMTRNALLLLNRVNDILDFSKADAGKFEVCWEVVNVAALLAPMMEDAAAAADGSGRTLTWSVDHALGDVTIDRCHLEKIVLNLVGNALKFTPAGGWIKVSVAPLDTDRFELSVADSGIGIATDKQAALFNRFHQVDTSATRQYGGTGIGLALVRQSTELMGGEVGVDSEAGKGACFFVRLSREPSSGTITAPDGPGARSDPLHRALRTARFEEGCAAVTSAGTCAQRPPADGRRPRVLVADDNADMRGYIASLLAEDYAVTPAEDGLQAWTLLQQQPFDLVVSDVMMPGLDGLGLTARIKGITATARIPVLLVTARGGADASTAGLDTGADDYLAKPFSPSELKARVQAALRMAALQARLRDAARDTGMTLLASGILHNVGNLLCNVSISAAMMHDALRRSDPGHLMQIAGLLRGISGPPQAVPPELPEFVEEVAQHLLAERERLLAEVVSVRHGLDHAAGIIAAQRDFAKTGCDMVELVSVDSLLDTAFALSRHRFTQLGIDIERRDAPDAVVRVDRYKALQILLNLLANAADALQSASIGKRQLLAATERREASVCIVVRDTGCGIEAHHLANLFSQGFSTKGNGHGYGLHLSALWARECGGSLRGLSDGPGSGATFILELPAPPGPSG